jgi:tetratricopeptide (TPR) repeat protein
VNVFRLVAAASLFLLTASASAQETAESADAHDEEGARYYERKMWDAARKEWLAAYAADPRPRYLFNIGQAYRKENLHAEAVDYFLRYLAEMERPENKGLKIDPTIKVDLDTYIAQIRAELERVGQGRKKGQSGPEPAPYLVGEEIVEAEELFDQIVKEHKAGNTAVANDLVKRMEEIYRLRGDPLLLLYFAQAYEKMGKRREALEAYRRYLVADPPDPPRKRLAADRFAALSPPPPGQRYLWPSLVFGILGLAGVATGLGLYVEVNKNFADFQSPISESEKRDRRLRGENLGLGSVISYAAGGGLLVGSAIFLGVALSKGVRNKNSLRLSTLPGATGLALEGSF